MLNLRSFRQSAGYCGPASLKIVLDYYGVKMSERALAELSGATRERGVSGRSLVSAAKKLGFDARMKDNTSIEELEALAKNTPVIVDWFHPSEEGHYSVVAGFRKGNVILADPCDGGFVEISRSEFEDRWFDFYGDRPKSGYLVRRMIVIEKKE